MATDPTKVVVTEGATGNTSQAYHHDFPEIRADGHSGKEAATLLVNRLKLAMDTALTEWRRETMTQAIADVEAFVKSQA
ncbi:hypothetical protein OJF2_13520 [Aquisphaera giovannonii]|uniref:Uncharacterized protein n=1 Tax=Aquisphaera giovannonii TaxID=406548 RepID=A0A5B9VY01_9BACT|nr:hypothetical protein [Aquisphaera giovannonii]QEH32867.1 hypothetical protein OJF2_13520 [Aquisphaera giovannonii]